MADSPSEQIEQGYLTEASDSIQVRLRRRDGSVILGIKRGTGRTREETEVELTPEQSNALWALTAGRRVKKTRHRVDHGAMTIEVDVFADELEGLRMAEIEFSSESESDAFEGPEWLGREVTGMREFENEVLAEEGLPVELR